jgi:hypothetical protein
MLLIDHFLKKGPMKKAASAFLCIPAAFLLFAGDAGAYDGKQVNARAVSVQWRHGVSTDWAAMCSECWNGFPMGQIMVYTIRNGVVQANPATIYTREKGFAEYPAFNLSGTKIAFYRSSQASTTASSTAGTTVNGGKSYISVINTDGSGLTNLVEIPANPEGYGNGDEIMPLDWPAGDWIYYEKPYDSASAPAGDPSSVDIWKVNVVTKVAQRVCDFAPGSKCAYWRRFTLTALGDKMAGQTMPKYECSGTVPGGNCVWDFPNPGCNLSNGKGECRAACNISISPSGAVVGSYFSGAHTQLELGENTPGVYSFGWGWGIDLFNQVTVWAGEDVGAGCELIRWAVNSDKWVMQNVGWYGHAGAMATGSNSVACNWIDKVAFNITKNPKLPQGDANGVMYINNCTGDMWIDDPVNNPNKNSYEDLQGAWHVVPGATAVEDPGVAGRDVALDGTFSIASSTAPAIRVHVPHHAPWKVSIAGVDGRILHSLTGTSAGEVTITAADLGIGVRVITLAQGGKHIVNRCVVK